jgi:hypothetical protein
MSSAIEILFRNFTICRNEKPELYKRFHFYFIGTSYAASGKGEPTIFPVAEKYGLGDVVTESTDRIPFYQALNTLADADALFIAGSDDRSYTASKIFPYVETEKPVLAVFHPQSSVVSILQSLKVGTVLQFGEKESCMIEKSRNFFEGLLSGVHMNSKPDREEFEKYSARSMTGKQCALFNEVVS